MRPIAPPVRQCRHCASRDTTPTLLQGRHTTAAAPPDRTPRAVAQAPHLSGLSPCQCVILTRPGLSTVRISGTSQRGVARISGATKPPLSTRGDREIAYCCGHATPNQSRKSPPAPRDQSPKLPHPMVCMHISVASRLVVIHWLLWIVVEKSRDFPASVYAPVSQQCSATRSVSIRHTCAARLRHYSSLCSWEGG
jgi:hypothetical protein